MSRHSLSREHQSFLDRHAEGVISGDLHEVDVRPITFADIAALASGEGPQTFEAFTADNNGTLSPAIATVIYYRDQAPKVSTTYALNHATGRLDRSAPVGARIRVTIDRGNGVSSDRALFTTEEAEEEAGHGTSQDPASTRLGMFLPEDGPLDEIDAHDEAHLAMHYERRALTPLYGSEMTVRCVVSGVDPSALKARVLKMLAREFGTSLGAVIKVDAKPVTGERVDVFDAETGRPLAIDVLAAESSYLMGSSESGLIETRSAATNGVIVGRR